MNIVRKMVLFNLRERGLKVSKIDVNVYDIESMFNSDSQHREFIRKYRYVTDCSKSLSGYFHNRSINQNDINMDKSMETNIYFLLELENEVIAQMTEHVKCKVEREIHILNFYERDKSDNFKNCKFYISVKDQWFKSYGNKWDSFVNTMGEYTNLKLYIDNLLISLYSIFKKKGHSIQYLYNYADTLVNSNSTLEELVNSVIAFENDDNKLPEYKVSIDDLCMNDITNNQLPFNNEVCYAILKHNNEG